MNDNLKTALDEFYNEESAEFLIGQFVEFSPKFERKMKHIRPAVSVSKHTFKAVMIAAAAAAAVLAIAVGIHNLGGITGNHISPADTSHGVSYVASSFEKSNTSTANDSFDNVIRQNWVNVDGKTYFFTIYSQDLHIPDAYKLEQNTPGVFKYLQTFSDLDMRPTDLFAEFGFKPLLNDCFSENLDVESKELWTTNENNEDVYLGKPAVANTIYNEITFKYYLYNKNIGKNVFFNVTSSDYGHFIQSLSDMEIVHLNDGSVAIVNERFAEFAYNGLMYYIDIPTSDDPTADNTDDIKQVLADLGVL